MKRILQFLSYVLVAALASAVTCIFCVGTGGGNAKLDRLRSIIDEYYIGEVDHAALDDAAAAAMVQATGDRWSYYIPASQLQSHQDSQANSYVGVGITITVREDGQGFDIVQVAKGGGAEAAGIQPGDILTHVEGISVVAEGLDGASERIVGDPGTTVEVTVLRQDQSLDFTLERRRIQVEVVSWQMLEGQIGYIKIANFHSRCASESIKAIEELRGQGAKALIFDVRNNGGGYKDEMVRLLDYLLPEGPLFRSEDYSGAVEVDESDEAFLDMPMAVLVNANSYSAAEFFAAALWEYEAALVAGQQTTGKGHFQVTFDLKDGSAVNLSIGKYTTPKGVNLDGVGLTPDIEIAVTEEQEMKIYYGTLDPAEDPQLQAAADALRNN